MKNWDLNWHWSIYFTKECGFAVSNPIEVFKLSDTANKVSSGVNEVGTQDHSSGVSVTDFLGKNGFPLTRLQKSHHKPKLVLLLWLSECRLRALSDKVPVHNVYKSRGSILLWINMSHSIPKANCMVPYSNSLNIYMPIAKFYFIIIPPTMSTFLLASIKYFQCKWKYLTSLYIKI